MTREHAARAFAVDAYDRSDQANTADNEQQDPPHILSDRHLKAALAHEAAEDINTLVGHSALARGHRAYREEHLSRMKYWEARTKENES